MERATNEITTVNGHKVVLKSFVTGFEKRQIAEVYLDAKDIKELHEGEKKQRPMFTAEDLSINLVVVSLDGSTENVLHRILNEIQGEDYDEIKTHIAGIIDGKKKVAA